MIILIWCCVFVVWDVREVLGAEFAGLYLSGLPFMFNLLLAFIVYALVCCFALCGLCGGFLIFALGNCLCGKVCCGYLMRGTILIG